MLISYTKERLLEMEGRWLPGGPPALMRTLQMHDDDCEDTVGSEIKKKR